MGSIINAICKCGFEAKDCFIGVGVNYPNDLWNPEPAICFHCSRFQISNYKSKSPRCSICSKKIVFYRDEISLSIYSKDHLMIQGIFAQNVEKWIWSLWILEDGIKLITRKEILHYTP
jgi:hypothetical protein